MMDLVVAVYSRGRIRPPKDCHSSFDFPSTTATASIAGVTSYNAADLTEFNSN
jgi:hypothetical protein